MKRKHILAIVIILILALIIYKLATNKKKINEKNTPVKQTDIRIPVKVTDVTEQQLEISLIKTGSVTPFKEAKVLSATSGIIRELRFNLGDHVSEGQILAVMDSRALQLDLQKSESNVKRLKNDLNTYTELLQGKAATQEKVNTVRQDYIDAVSQSGQYRKQLSDASVKAPTSGIIATKPVEQGVFVNAAADIGTIVNLTKVKIEVTVTENEVYQIVQGQDVKISVDAYPGKNFTGKVTFISPQADETHSYTVEITATNNEQTLLRSGTFVYTDFSKKTTQNILLIPREALTESTKDASVYVVQNNVVRKRAITTGAEMKGMIQVTKGLNKGEIVVTSGQINLKEGTPVSVSK